jgi:signal transduction histidine kinase
MLSEPLSLPPHDPPVISEVVPPATAARWWRPSVPPVVLFALAITALFSALVFSVSEVVFAQTVTLQQRMAVLMEARVNALRIQGEVQHAQAAQWAFISTQNEAQLDAMQQASRQALLHFGLLQGLLNAYPDLQKEAQALGSTLQAELSTAQVGPALARLENMDQSLLKALNRQQTELSQTLSRQRVGTAVLVGLSLLFLAVLAVRAIRHFYDQERQREALSNQALRLEAAVLERTNELNELSTYLQKQSEEEKAGLARELHDELGSLLTAAKLDTAWLQGRNPGDDPERTQRLKQLSIALDQALNIKRRVIESLQPSLLTHLGLGAALIWYIQQTCDKAALAHDVQVPEDGVDVDAETGLALYRIVQESLNNTIRHAHAREVHVALHQAPEGHTLLIEDDGIGIVNFRPDQLSHGLAGMRHRATAMGGRFAVSSKAGKGTRIEVQVPRRPTRHSGQPAKYAEATAEAGFAAADPRADQDQDINPCVTA